MGYYIKGNVNCEKSFVRYIYQDIRDELKNLWKTMLTVLGMLGLAISYVLKMADNLPLFYVYLYTSQLLWVFAMIEILLYSNYISKHKFLIELELGFDPSLKNRGKKKAPFWQSWASEDNFSGFSGYTISVLSICLWSFLAFLGLVAVAALKACSEENLYKYIFFYVLTGLEFVAAFCASLMTFKEYQKAKDLLK
jgi:hypothetical protein